MGIGAGDLSLEQLTQKTMWGYRKEKPGATWRTLVFRAPVAEEPTGEMEKDEPEEGSKLACCTGRLGTRTRAKRV